MWPFIIPAAAAGVYLLVRELTAGSSTMPPMPSPTQRPREEFVPPWISRPEDMPTTPGVTVAAELPSTDLPTGAKTWGDVDDRFRDIVLFNFRSGRWDEAETLVAANLLLADLKSLGVPVEVDELGIQISSLIKQIGESPA